MDGNASVQEVEWQDLYAELTRVLSAVGRENAFGEGDFWIVDDNYGSLQHKVCVTRIAYLTPELVASVQRLLSSRHPRWEVLLTLDGPGLRPTSEDKGVTVGATETKELWSRSRMTKAHGNQFRWQSPNAG
jgi:hypothetical protein